MCVVLIHVASAVVRAARHSPDMPATAASAISPSTAARAPTPMQHPASSPPVRGSLIPTLQLSPSTVLNQGVAESRHLQSL